MVCFLLKAKGKWMSSPLTPHLNCHSPRLVGGVVPVVARLTLLAETTLRSQGPELGRNRPALETEAGHDVVTTTARIGCDEVDNPTGGHAPLASRTGRRDGLRAEHLREFVQGQAFEG